MEYEISDDHGFAGDYEVSRVRHTPSAPSSVHTPRTRRDRAMHIPEQEG